MVAGLFVRLLFASAEGGGRRGRPLLFPLGAGGDAGASGGAEFHGLFTSSEQIARVRSEGERYA